MPADKIRRHSLNGRKDFQVIIIRRSYRIRGRAARTQINKAANKVVEVKIATGAKISGLGLNINSAADSRLTTRILQYSAIKIRANLPPPYSTLNPDTSSDSPSAKSKGARLVSAKRVTNQAMNSGGIITIRGTEWLIKGVVKLKDKSRDRAERSKRAMEISYEMVCAILRVVPKSAYLLLEDHPAINVGYTLRLDVARKAKVANGTK